MITGTAFGVSMFITQVKLPVRLLLYACSTLSSPTIDAVQQTAYPELR